jgi:putative hydrolase of the HAD superfamily
VTPVALQAVVFDWGHTLLDFALAEEALHDCYEQVREQLAEQAYDGVPEAATFVRDLSHSVGARVTRSYEERELEELDIVALFDDAFRAIGYALPTEQVRRVVEMEHRALTGALVMSSENLDVLRTLKEWGLRIGVVSNVTFVPELVQEDIDRLGIGQYVDVPVYSAAFGVRKPHPSIFRHVLERLDVAAEDGLFVGDRLNDDIAGAQAIGMGTVLTHEFRREEVEPGGVRPDRVIETLPELLPYVRSILDRLEE